MYNDESYVHNHHQSLYHSLFHPTLSDDGKTPQYKGRRFCFVAAIGGEGKHENVGLIPGSTWLFCPTAKSASSCDYHKVFNSTNYVNWFKTKLLPNLMEPSLIILDNSRYHRCKPPSTPNANKMKKSEILKMLNDIGISFESGISVTEARLLLRKWQKEHILPEIVQLAAEEGHKVIFTPPHHSDLQPIESLWARIKSAIAK